MEVTRQVGEILGALSPKDFNAVVQLGPATRPNGLMRLNLANGMFEQQWEGEYGAVWVRIPEVCPPGESCVRRVPPIVSILESVLEDSRVGLLTSSGVDLDSIAADAPNFGVRAFVPLKVGEEAPDWGAIGIRPPEGMRYETDAEFRERLLKFEVPVLQAGSAYRPIAEAPHDGTWILLRSRNNAGRKMVPVVVAWNPIGAGDNRNAWIDSASFHNCDSLAAAAGADFALIPTDEDQVHEPANGSR